MELSLYNGILAGVSLDGLRFFYVNPLASLGNHHRSEWFGCACCPPNVVRILASLGSYAYALSEDALWVNLYIAGKAEAEIAGHKIELKVATEYPWNGDIKMVVKPDAAARFSLNLRVPGWSRGAVVKVNGKKINKPVLEKGYVKIDRKWKDGDRVNLSLPMPVETIEAHPAVREDAGQVAVQRGPVIYAFEACDQKEPLLSIGLPSDAKLKPEPSGILGGAVVLKGSGVIASNGGWTGKLYRKAASPRRVFITAVPYYAWDNRQPGAMRVWMPVLPPAPPAGGPARQRPRAVLTEGKPGIAGAVPRPSAIRNGGSPRGQARRE